MRFFLGLLVASVLFSALPAHAQFPKIKKLPKVGKTPAKTTQTANKANDVKDQANGAPAYDTNDPIYKAYSAAKNYLRSAESAINSSDWQYNRGATNEDIVEKLTKAQEKLTFLSEQGEGEKKYLKDLLQQHQTINQRRETEAADYLKAKAYKDKLELYYNWVVMGHEIKDPEVEASYSAYYKLRDAFVAEHPKEAQGDYAQKQIKAVDAFFKTGVNDYLTRIEKSLDKVIKEINKPMSTGEASYTLNADNYLEDLQNIEPTLARYEKDLFEDKTELQKVADKLQKEKAKLEAYISSGQLKAAQDKHAALLIDERRLRPNKMTDAEIVAFVKKNLEAKYGTALNVHIIFSNWMVEKTALGIPKFKYVKVDIATKKADGKCYYVKGSVGRTYEGGTYGDLYLNIYYTQGEMNCANVK